MAAATRLCRRYTANITKHYNQIMGRNVMSCRLSTERTIKPNVRLIYTSVALQGVEGIKIPMPALSPTMEEGTIVKWMKKEGDIISTGDALCEIETDKATMAMDAEEDGIMAKILVPEGTRGVKVNSLIALMVGEGEDYTQVELPADISESSSPEAEDSTHTSTSEPSHSAVSDIPLSPAVRLLVDLYDISPRDIQGSGHKGRILKGDALKFIADKGLKPAAKKEEPPVIPAPTPTAPQPVAAPTVAPPVAAPEPPPPPSPGVQFIDHPHTTMRSVIAKRLTESKATVPHAYSTMDCCMDNLLQMRKSLKGQGVTVSVNDFIIKIAAMTLRQVPEMNATWFNNEVKLLDNVDVSVAVSTDTGLITPIVKNASDIGVQEISSRIRDLAGRAREGKLQLDEFQGGSFTISNLGMFGIDEFSAVINPPQACIMAVGRSRPVVLDANKVSSVMTVTLSCDSRVVDDALAAKWLENFKRNIERPEMCVL